jgi:hypothetical protein
MSFPNFSEISDYAVTLLESRKGKTFDVSALNCYVKLYSGAGALMYANPNIQLFSAAGDSNPSTIYGNKERSGVIGVTWEGSPIITTNAGQSGKPSPIVTSLEIDEGEGNLSRKAKINIRCFSVSQLDDILKYYMEPGFSIFIQWGWNTPSGIKMAGKSFSAAEMANFENMSEVDGYRRASGGQSDVYLGFITGGSVSVSDSYWDVNIKCCGFTELPAYLMVADNQRNKNSKASDGAPEVEDYATRSWFATDDIDKKRWQFAFNSLPSNKKTKLVKALEAVPDVTNPVNFINFDPKIAEDINTKKDGSWFSRIFGDDDDIDIVDSDTGEEIEVELSDGVKLIGDERFIRFEALATIMNRLENKAYQIEGRMLKFAINTSTTVCSAFDNMFSTDRSKLFVPNEKTPGPSYYEIVATGGASTKADWVDNRVIYKGTTVAFPNNGAIADGVATNTWGRSVNIFYKYPGSAAFTKNARTWGFLGDLYINFDFAKGILETKNYLIKDALYQILNGISTAVGGLWDFQILSLPNPKTGTLELTVVDMNLSNEAPDGAKTVRFDLTGANSVFLDASFDMDIGGAMMNQIIGEKNSKSLNSSSPTAEGKLFTGTGVVSDKIKVKVIEEQSKGTQKWQNPASDNVLEGDGKIKDNEKKEITQAFAAFLGKVCLAPHVELKEGQWEDQPYEYNYMCAYADQAWFELFKIGAEAANAKGVSILLPIKFSFTSHGVSGIKRGDKFIVEGLPQKYSTNGFFQVTGIKHTISGMLWKTEVIGGFRQLR